MKSARASASRVLIVDHLTDDACGLKISLELRGHEALVASSLQQALSLFCGFEPQVVLVNPAAIGAECLELIDRLHQFPRYGKLTLVAVTCGQELSQAEMTAFDRIIDAPIQLEVLLELLAVVTKPEKLRRHKFSRPRK